MKILTLIARIVALGGAGFVLLGMICFAAGGRFNSTRSIPLGLYWLTDDPVASGAYVIFCPPVSYVFDEARDRGYISAGYCPGGYGFMMKRVLATADDRIEQTAQGIRINSKPLLASKPMNTDKAGRAMPRYPASSYRLRNNELLLMSDVSATSFDSRYFGPIHTLQIRGVLKPLLTW